MAKSIFNFWLIGFCSIWILTRVEMKYNELNFDVIALGHSGLLISWDPDKITENDGRNISRFLLTYQAITEKSIKPPVTLNGIRSDVGQYQISKLNQETRYQISITHTNWLSGLELKKHKQRATEEDRVRREVRLNWRYDTNHYHINHHCSGRTIEDLRKGYDIQKKTGPKTNSLPQEPDFKWVLNNAVRIWPYMSIIINWLPCGKYRTCDESTSTHFSVRYRAIESKHWFESGDIYDGFYEIVGMVPGRMYEVTVNSINNGLKTASETEIIFIKPYSGPVRDVKAIQLNSTSLLVIWKPPLNQLYPIDEYGVTHIKSRDTTTIEQLWSFKNYSDTDWTIKSARTSQSENGYKQIVISDLQPATEYNIFIRPVMVEEPIGRFFYGIEYSLSYTLHLQSSKNLPLSTPDFNIIVVLLKCRDRCNFRIQWLPCGMEFECKNTRPGSSYKLQVKNKITGDIKYDVEITKEYSDFIEVQKTEIYEVTVQNVDGSELSQKLTKIVDVCVCEKTE